MCSGLLRRSPRQQLQSCTHNEGHTSKPGPDSDSDPKKTRTREKPGLVLGLAFKKPGLDNRKPGLQIENTGFDETGF